MPGSSPQLMAFGSPPLSSPRSTKNAIAAMTSTTITPPAARSHGGSPPVRCRGAFAPGGRRRPGSPPDLRAWFARVASSLRLLICEPAYRRQFGASSHRRGLVGEERLDVGEPLHAPRRRQSAEQRGAVSGGAQAPVEHRHDAPFGRGAPQPPEPLF